MNRHLTTTNKNELWDLFDKFLDFEMPTFGQHDFSPKIEVKDNGKSYQICAEVPGMDEKDINITLKDKQLILEGEKRNEYKDEDKKKGYFHSEFSYGRFYRAIPLSDDVDTEKVKANYKNGVLFIDVEKLAGKESKTRKIEIQH
jgi:HSP20 family protein